MFNNLLLFDNIWVKSLICLSLSYFLGYFGIKLFLNFVNNKQICRQPIRSDGPQNHVKDKKNTPTMGGIFILLSTFITSLLLLDLSNPYLLIILLVMLLFGLIGLTDDLLKVVYKNPKGFPGSVKIIIQFAIISAAILWLGNHDHSYLSGKIFLPIGTGHFITIGLSLYVLFVTFVIVGSSNAVNLTDGLDGLVSVPAVINLICLSIIISSTSDLMVAKSLRVPHIENVQELIFFCASLIGAILAFLTFNLKPAKIFMGDVGSLAIGSVLGLIAIITKQEFVFFIISIVFVTETVSVVLQVVSYKLRKKRIFLMAPIHHHFEKLGWSEKKVVRSFWAASMFFALLGMAIFLY
jgi:phospho-N-acetylmuramoyl-pentapeptide-transferase